MWVNGKSNTDMGTPLFLVSYLEVSPKGQLNNVQGGALADTGP